MIMLRIRIKELSKYIPPPPKKKKPDLGKVFAQTKATKLKSFKFEHVLQLPFSQSFIIDFVKSYFNCWISVKTHKLLHFCKDTKLSSERQIRQRQLNILIKPLVPKKDQVLCGLATCVPCYQCSCGSLFCRAPETNFTIITFPTVF